MWKTMPGRIKQVPQDSTEWDRTDTGHCTKNIYKCDFDIDYSSDPSSNKLKEILEVIYAFSLESDSRSLYYLDLFNKLKFANLSHGSKTI